MIITICDKCKKHSAPWRFCEWKTYNISGNSLSVSFTLCDDCRESLGLSESSQYASTVQKEDTASRLLDIMQELANEAAGQ